MAFDWDYAAGKAQQSVVLEAATASAKHGVREAELSLPWVKTASQATATATDWLEWRARPLWILRFETGLQFQDLQPGGWIYVQHPRLPFSGEYVVLDVDPGYGGGAVTLSAQASAGNAPEITLIRQSIGFDA